MMVFGDIWNDDDEYFTMFEHHPSLSRLLTLQHEIHFHFVQEFQTKNAKESLLSNLRTLIFLRGNTIRNTNVYLNFIDGALYFNVD